MVDKNMRRHDKCLDILIQRLSKKPGLSLPKQEYYAIGTHLQGEMDVHRITTNSQKREFHRYYEVKGRHSQVAYNKAIEQFQRTQEAFPNIKWKFIYVTPTMVLRVKP